MQEKKGRDGIMEPREGGKEWRYRKGDRKGYRKDNEKKMTVK